MSESEFDRIERKLNTLERKLNDVQFTLWLVMAWSFAILGVLVMVSDRVKGLMK